jgi:hypothetical protein
MRLASGAFFAANAAKNRAFRYKSSELPMQFLWAFRCNPIAHGSLRTNSRNCHRHFREHIIAALAIMCCTTRRSQFCSDKIAGSVTKHEAKRNARIYHQPAAGRQLKIQAPVLPAAKPGAHNCSGNYAHATARQEPCFLTRRSLETTPSRAAMRKGLERKAHRICISKSEDL